MKNFAAATIVIMVLMLASCDPAATFDNPQPANVKSLTTFPERLQGKYLAADLASILTVTDRWMTRHYDLDYKVHKDSIGNSYKLIGDTLINEADGTKEKVIFKGDTIVQHANWTDTLFNFSADNDLRKFKGYYFLNRRYSDSTWSVAKLLLQKGQLTISNSGIDDIQKLKEITETTADTTSTHFTLTRQQFKQFVKQEGFAEQETFTRMAENGR